MVTAASKLVSGAASEAERLLALSQVSLQAQLVHRGFKPLWANPQFADLFLFDSVADILAQPSLANLFDQDASGIAPGLSLFGRRTLRRRDGAEFRAELFGRRIAWDGEDAVALAILDVSCEERAIIDLAESRREADAAALARRQLLAALAGDLHTPLLEAVAALNAESLNGAARNARSACRTLLRHVEEALDNAARDSEVHVGRPAPCDLAAIARDAVARQRRALEAVDVTLSMSPPSGAHVLADRACLSGLINALLRAARAEGRAVRCDIEIGQDGVSIAVETGERAPSQIKDSLRPARPLAAALGGIVIERGRGRDWSAVAFLPLPLCPVRQAEPARDILVIDDQPRARRILEAAIIALGHRPVLASSGAEGVDLFAGRAFDLVLCDLNMPGMDGCEAARRMRRTPTPWSAAPIAAVTASTAQRMRDAAAEAGMDAFLEKPLSLARLDQAIAMLTNGAPISVQPAERGQVKQEHQHDETADDADREHVSPPFGRARRDAHCEA